eukprot:TRINITY_DN11755_c0_g1_i6.p1 TRINITY_DN11755_c0_g1~~TRINITY_DN11755_c0_g1_i6.p1  ORF type:complete len:659 (+),score=121.05 TRINITY_DN11755_c0_g1_i6:151-1977(+)
MYQTVGHEMIELLAQAIALPLYRQTVTGTCVSADKTYTKTQGDEVEDLYQLLTTVKDHHPDIQAVSVGAILSDYQRTRVEAVCSRLGLTSLAYLWQYDQPTLLREMLDCQLSAVVIKVAAMGLNPRKHAGKTLNQLEPLLLKLHTDYEVHVCGEGGEYETFVVDCCLFASRIVLDQTELVIHSDDAFAPVGYLVMQKAHLEPKEGFAPMTQAAARKMLTNAGCQLYNPAESHLNATSPLPDSVKMLRTFVCQSNSAVSGSQAAEQALDQLKSKVAAAGASLSAVVHINLTISDMALFAEINQVYIQYFGRNPPSRVCIASDQAVVVTLEALVIMDQTTANHLHVQGLSYWAPANIGPYSQAVQVCDMLCMAGQIGLDPASMQMVIPAVAQVKRALDSVQRVADMFSADTPSYLSCILYMANNTSQETLRQARQLCKLNACLVAPVVNTLPRQAQVEWHWTLSADAIKASDMHRVAAAALPTRLTARFGPQHGIAQVDIASGLTITPLSQLQTSLVEALQAVRSQLLHEYVDSHLIGVRAWAVQPDGATEAMLQCLRSVVNKSFGCTLDMALISCTRLIDMSADLNEQLVVCLQLLFEYSPQQGQEGCE